MSPRWSQSILESFLLGSRDEHYEPLHPSEESVEELKTEGVPVGKRGWPTKIVVAFIIATMIVSGTAGFVWGEGARRHFKSKVEVGVGFVKHAEISPNLSGLAVFHEIHCVNMLRVGYYAALNGNLADMQHVHDHNKRPDPHHLRHCFDYLRQSLMCMADTNLEPVDFALGGVTGWSFERTCRDFEAVKEWAEVNRAWDEDVEMPERR
ncbi:hypothetical protein P7C71_g2573, partial [Lecanoromycetidae sp. Uapishka_2]